ncbi:hypothetical protein FHS21_005217 [Phyllobacterium trifolii]|uniref:Uncharacterized protein n=1 Tax=Phyllobacterium trifolii TaxID=300193 RepID=A0A839UJT8_9HYPH|nr:hypothetical protein [Phyllobacterium trifolii]MBB3148769.1 hypothetical protein [Phyllobacterium trifolii]
MTAHATPPFDRLRQLLLLLGSDHDGEALSAARALVKTLHKAGYDLHWLGDQLFSPQSGPHKATSDAPDFTGMDWRLMAMWCLAKAPAGFLTKRQHDFLCNVAGYDRPPSEKQTEFLRDLAAKVRKVAMP